MKQICEGDPEDLEIHRLCGLCIPHGNYEGKKKGSFVYGRHRNRGRPMQKRSRMPGACADIFVLICEMLEANAKRISIDRHGPHAVR